MAKRAELESLRRESGRAEARMRLARALAVLPTASTVALTACVVAVAARKLAPEQVPEWAAWSVLVAAAVAVLAVIAVALVRRLPPQAGALALDRHHALAGRIANALAFGELPESKRTELMDMAIEDACRAAEKGLDAREAVRVPWPAELGVSAIVALALVGISQLEIRALVPIPEPPPARARAALEMSEDDLDLFRDALEEMRKDQESSEVREAIDQLNQLIEDIAARRLSREEAFRRMRELEDALAKGADEDKKALAEALAEMAKELEKSELAKPTADALAKKELGKAREALSKLAEQLRSKTKPDKAQLERLRKALDRASKMNEEALSRLDERRAELRRELLKKKQEQKDPQKQSEREKSLLRKKERELERLDRQREQREKAARRLERLDRQLAKAAADLLRDLGVSADEIEGLAEDINRLEQEELTEKEKEELRRRIQELRELIRQQGQGGEKMRQRLQRFLRRAGGGQQGGGRPGQQSGQGQEPGGDDGDLRQRGQGQRGQGMGDGSEEGGGGLVLGPGGKRIPIEVPGGGSGSGDQPGGEGSSPGESSSHGSGSAEKLGQSSDIDGKTIDVRAEGLDSQSGPSNAEVILGAADRGFSGKPYRNVYKQYQTVAEDRVDKEEIPDGMRFYVRRYFQLIRPRD